MSNPTEDSRYLVGLDSKGKIRVFYAGYYWSDKENAYKIERYSGQLGGKQTEGPVILVHVGKAKRSVVEQCILEWFHLIKEKLLNF